jgi:hypothetical protein
MNRHLDEVEETAASAEDCWAEMTRYLLACLDARTEVGDEVVAATWRRMRAYRAAHPELRWSQAVLLRAALVAIKISRGVA